ncbi:MAG: hypothetical protein RBT57_01575 [Paludibacter sp.]|jgi:hypothetical protein|nr:hypothetical protein [Paludibacter sp.]
MKKFFILTIALCTLALAVAAQNIVSNGNFENWTYIHKNIAGADSLAMPDNWLRGAGALGVNYLQENDVERGKVLRLVDADGATVNARRFSSTNIGIAESGVYRVSFWVKGNVGLRAVVLVKGTGAPSTNTQSATNHFTTITGFVSGTANLSSWTKVTADINVPTTATLGEDYRLHLSWSISTGTAPRPTVDFVVDDIVLQKLSDEGLNSINIIPLNYTATQGTPSFALNGFSPEILNYVFNTSYLDVPVVEATPARAGSQVSITQASSLTGALADRKATIIVTTNDSKVTVYTVEFRKNPGFISGIPWDIRNNTPVEWGEMAGVYTRNSSTGTNNNKFPTFGNTSLRCNATSETGFFITTPVLENGASTLSFFVKNFNIVDDQTPVVVQKSDDENPEWTEIHRLVPNTSDWLSWKEVILTINDNSPGLKIRFMFEKSITTSGTVHIDDVEIRPFGATATDNIAMTDIHVYAAGNQLIINSPQPVRYEVYTINGVKVVEAMSSERSSVTLEKGVYIVRSGNLSVKIVL